MAYVIPHSILQHQLCSECKRYLSYAPTKIYQTGEIKCGRCSCSGDGGAISAFETMAKNIIFPCVNRFDGCTSTLHYMDVKEHEKSCTGTEVKCPICLNDELPLLYLIHHFKRKHPKCILESCVIDASLMENFTKCFLKYDFETNRIFLIGLNWDNENLSINCATIVESEEPGVTTTIQVSFFTDDVDEVCLDSTDAVDCLELKSYLLDPFQQGFTYKVPPELAQIRCKLVFNCTLPFLKVEQFITNNDAEFKKKILPKMYLDIEFKEKYKDLDLAGFKLSSCGQKMLNNNYSLQIACDFCGNLFASSGFIKEIYYDVHCYICGTCYSRGITKSLKNNGTDLDKLADTEYHLLNFYCKFGCKKFFRSGELLSHEDQCILNKHRLLSEEDHVKSYFGGEFLEEAAVSRENVILYEPQKFDPIEQICVATRENFKCVIDYEQDAKLNLGIFHINHKYDTRKYYILVHKWENNTFSTEYNDFSMKIENCDGPSIFAINLREIQEDLEIFYDV